MADDVISGFFGIVIQPDAATIETSYAIAAALLPADAVQLLAPGTLPHVTLAQFPLRDAPRQRVAAVVQRLDAQLRARTMPLSAVTPFGGGFLFWCVEAASPERALLQQAHEDAITVGEGLLDPAGTAAVVEATIKVTNGDPLLVANARRYGYAFVRDRYLPHVTLGFDPRLAAAALTDRRHVMTVERVVLARLGALGRVESVVSC